MSRNEEGGHVEEVNEDLVPEAHISMVTRDSVMTLTSLTAWT